MNPNVPTGNTTDIMRQYFEYLYSYYLGQTGQNYFIHWDILVGVLVGLGVLAGLFYAYTRWQRNTNTTREPYPLESYNGYIQEANGRVGPFLSVFFVLMFVWLVVTTLNDLIHGQIY